MADRPFELQSRDEKILAATIDGTEYTDVPQSRIEYLLLELKEAIEGGGGGGGHGHNGIFSGRDLTEEYTIEQMYEKIHDGSFDDLFLGDYFTKSITTDIYTHFTGAEFDSGTTYYEMDGTINDRTWTETSDTEPQSVKTYATKLTKTENVTLMFAAFDYYYNMGDTALTTHHAVLIPRGAGFAVPAKMNAINTTEGGYYNSDMHQLILPCYAKSLKTALNGHLLAHRSYLSNSINATAASRAGGGIKGAASGATYVDTELQLMSEQQVYGTEALTSSPYDIGLDYGKLPVFNYINPILYERNDFWLRTVGSTKWFAACFENGFSGGKDAYEAHYARPLIIFG